MGVMVNFESYDEIEISWIWAKPMFFFKSFLIGVSIASCGGEGFFEIRLVKNIIWSYLNKCRLTNMAVYWTWIGKEDEF